MISSCTINKLLAFAAALSFTPAEAVDARDTEDRSAEIRAVTYDTKRDCTATLEVQYGTGARNLQGRGRMGMLGYDHIKLLIRQTAKGAVIDITGAAPDDTAWIPVYTPLKDVKSLDLQMRYHQTP